MRRLRAKGFGGGKRRAEQTGWAVRANGRSTEGTQTPAMRSDERYACIMPREAYKETARAGMGASRAILETGALVTLEGEKGSCMRPSEATKSTPPREPKRCGVNSTGEEQSKLLMDRGRGGPALGRPDFLADGVALLCPCPHQLPYGIAHQHSALHAPGGKGLGALWRVGAPRCQGQAVSLISIGPRGLCLAPSAAPWPLPLLAQFPPPNSPESHRQPHPHWSPSPPLPDKSGHKRMKGGGGPSIESCGAHLCGRCLDRQQCPSMGGLLVHAR